MMIHVNAVYSFRLWLQKKPMRGNLGLRLWCINVAYTFGHHYYKDTGYGVLGLSFSGQLHKFT
jgi:hypothetical protein